ncbi:inactive pancreatic lipase-related protein 1-like [Brevipalpus obovatus]|uniref:inactive pancreatic lipase-related protein 1-like n=1 Tax=Brevipalpus obovatus TaxID=246614 RepID=UPI003D9F3AF2
MRMTVIQPKISMSTMVLLTFLLSVDGQSLPFLPADYTPFINRKVFTPCLKPVCYDDVGCIQPFRLHAYLSTPPVAACPEEPKNVGFAMRVLLKSNSEEFFTTKWLKPRKKVAFFIHGYQLEYSERFAMDIAYSLLREYPQVVLIKWDPGSFPAIIWDLPVSRYNRYTAAANSELIGRLTGNLVAEMVSNGTVRQEDVTVIGHGLGGNAIHYLAEWIKEQHNMTIGRAVVLDQDGVPFYFSNKKLTGVGDANVVDCIHTTFTQPIPFLGQRISGSSNTGSIMATCDTDYYVNFPDSIQDQEGCSGIQLCSTHFAPLVYSAYLNGCKYELMNCNSIKRPFSGSDSEKIGLDSTKYGKRGKICIKTSSRPLSSC